MLLWFSCSVMSSFLWPHGLQHTRLPCPSLSPGVCSHSCLVSQLFHPTILSSVVTFSSCPQSFPASGSFPMSRFFTLGGQSIGDSTSVLPMNIQGWLPLGLTGQVFLSKGLSGVFSSTTGQSFSSWRLSRASVSGADIPSAWISCKVCFHCVFGCLLCFPFWTTDYCFKVSIIFSCWKLGIHGGKVEKHSKEILHFKFVGNLLRNQNGWIITLSQFLFLFASEKMTVLLIYSLSLSHSLVNSWEFFANSGLILLKWFSMLSAVWTVKEKIVKEKMCKFLSSRMGYWLPAAWFHFPSVIKYVVEPACAGNEIWLSTYLNQALLFATTTNQYLGLKCQNICSFSGLIFLSQRLHCLCIRPPG